MADDTHTPLLNSASTSTFKSECSVTFAASSTSAASTESPAASHSVRQPLPQRLRVGIIGTGNYALALTRRLTLHAGCDVILGSRKPQQRRLGLSATRDCLCGVELASIADCLNTSDIVIVAIHKEDFRITLKDFAHLTVGKIVVDVSNREYRYPAQSNAEYLASILPGAIVVKAFNSISAMAMEDSDYSSETRVTYVAGNDPEAREKIMTLAQAMGFRAVNLGPLTSARWMEDFVLKVFPHWKIPVFLAFGIFNLWTLYIVYVYFIEKPTPTFKWEQIFLKVLNKPLCMTAITMLALTYLPASAVFLISATRAFHFGRSSALRRRVSRSV
ncbi:metalloreductase steap2 [Plakobranchus ocellatus]|uniref:Metalloreductase steap2 n=1 Tax=Plakobranchus ocellatus TaxID=259542 RepID=A0AAV3XZF9_9GAST|nr:metalloreductase steap2 [Plakobranchus ocellatus]